MRIPHQILDHRNRTVRTEEYTTHPCGTLRSARLGFWPGCVLRFVPAPICSLQLQTWAYDLGSGVRFARSNLSASSLLNIEQGALVLGSFPVLPVLSSLLVYKRTLPMATAAAAAGGRPESRPALALPEAARARLEAARARPGQRRARRLPHRLPRRLPRPRQAVRC